MLSHLLASGATYDRPEHDGRDDGVIGITENRYEIGNQVDREREIGEQQPHAQLCGAWYRGISDQPAEQAHCVREEAHELPQGGASRASDYERDRER